MHGAVATLMVGLGSFPAAAQQKARDPAAAEQLYKAGRDLIAKGDWAAGCPKFEASMELDPAASTLLNIAKCFEHDGRLARAWAEYKRALVVNQDTPGAERQKALAEIAHKAIAAIEPRLPRLRIVMSRKPDGLRITRDGQELPLALLGDAIPADPGEHEIVASAPGYGTDKHSVTLAEGKTTEVTLSLSPQSPAESVSPAARPKGDSPGPSPPAGTLPQPVESRSGGIPVWAWISGGLGVALVGAGIGFRIDMAAVEKTLDEKCGVERICDPSSGYDPTSDNARKNRDFALFLALGGVGIAGIGASVIGIVTAPKSSPAPRSAHVTASPWVAPTGFGLSFHGVY